LAWNRSMRIGVSSANKPYVHFFSMVLPRPQASNARDGSCCQGSENTYGGFSVLARPAAAGAVAVGVNVGRRGPPGTTSSAAPVAQIYTYAMDARQSTGNTYESQIPSESFAADRVSPMSPLECDRQNVTIHLPGNPLRTLDAGVLWKA
jgi:hypothetical protein